MFGGVAGAGQRLEMGGEAAEELANSAQLSNIGMLE